MLRRAAPVRPWLVVRADAERTGRWRDLHAPADRDRLAGPAGVAARGRRRHALDRVPATLGVDANYSLSSLGVLVHAELPGHPRSGLVDMAPQTTDFGDAKLPVGAPWVNPLGNMKLTVNSAGPGGATVTTAHKYPRVPSVTGHRRADRGPGSSGAWWRTQSMTPARARRRRKPAQELLRRVGVAGAPHGLAIDRDRAPATCWRVG